MKVWVSVLIFLLCSCELRGLRLSFDLAGRVPSLTRESEEFYAAFFQTTGAHLTPGHTWSMESNGGVFDDIESDIEKARVSVNLVEYIWEPGKASDQLLSALRRRARGVSCRILVDALGSPEFERNVAPPLRQMGCEARVFRPLTARNILERNHRKIVVLDGRVAYLGGFGVRDEWFPKKRRRWSASRRVRLRMTGEWRDDNIRIVGPVVAEAQRAFAQNWQESGGSLLPALEFPEHPDRDGSIRAAFVSSGAGYVTIGERLIHLLVKSARRRILIANAYFVPDGSLLRLLLEKAASGVEIRVLVPGRKNDLFVASVGQRSLYKDLLGTGIRIFEYQPTMMHAKTMVIDDRLAVIGSLNLNLLSLNRLEEAVFVVEDPKLVLLLEQSFRADLRQSKEVTR